VGGIAGTHEGYRRRQPEKTVLYQVLAEHLETFLERAHADSSRPGLPRFVERELRSFLSCGLLCRGFARVHCPSCKRDSLVAFSCKGRAFCPACGGRRMAETAAHLVDAVFPSVPVRQWVVTFPFWMRNMLAYDPALLSGVRRIFVRTVHSYYRAHAKRRGIEKGSTGSVAFVQRLDSAIRLNVHLHVAVLDGVYASSLFGDPLFHPLPTPSRDDIAHLTRKVHRRVLAFLRKKGRLPDEDAGDPGPDDPSAHDACIAGAVQGRHAMGPRAGHPIPRLMGPEPTPEVDHKKLACRYEGFSVHAGRKVGQDSRHSLEQLLRYAARPALSHDRLTRGPNHTLLYQLKRKWRDGSTAIVFTPQTLLERLAALVPRPRFPLVTYHGVLAPAAPWRKLIVPTPPGPPPCVHAAEKPDDTSSAKRASGRRRRYYSWAELMHRVFRLDLLVCPWCSGPRKVLAFLTDPLVIRKILSHLRLPTQAPDIAPARPPP